MQTTKNMQEQDHFPQPQPLRISISQNDTKTILHKLSNFNNLDSSQKTLTVQNLPIMLDQLEEEGVSLLKSLATEIMRQSEYISANLLDKVPQLIMYLEKYPNFDKNLKKIIIPIIIEFLNSQNLQIKQQAGLKLSLAAHKLLPQDRGEFVLKHVLLMSHDDTNENNRLIAVQLMSNLTDCLGKDLYEQFIGLEFLSMGDDTEKVKKQAINKLPIISKMLSQELFQARILPFYYSKAGDSKNWGIRKSCADIILDITELAPSKQRQTELTEIMLQLLNDNSRWVKLSAYKSLGKFIYFLKDLNINERLFQKYLKMVENDVTSLSSENQIAYSCAYNFPAVISVMGLTRWPEMFATYSKLLKQADKKIKMTLSQSLHEIAKIIGGKATQEYLLGVIDTFLREQNQDVKLGIIKNVSQIMSVLSNQRRDIMIRIFQQFQKDQKKWRIRLTIAKQLPKMLKMYTPETIFQYMVPILLALCSDHVSIVREEAAKCCNQFLNSLKDSQSYFSGLIESLKAFGTSPSFSRRIEFILVCKSLLSNKPILQTNFLQTLLQLKNDKVFNVKLSLGTFLDHYFKKDKKWSHLIPQENCPADIKLKELYEEMKNNCDEEMKEIFEFQTQ